MIIDGYLKVPDNHQFYEVNKLLKLECLCNNPEYYTRKKMGFSLRNIPKKISFRKKVGNEFWYPRFLAEEYIKNFKKYLNLSYGSNIEFKTRIKLRDFQIPVVEETLKFMKSHLGGCIQAIVGSGKCCSFETTKVLTDNGFKKLKNVKVGDYIYDNTGNTVKVIKKINDGFKKCYRVRFSDNTFVDCDQEQLFRVKKYWGSKEVDVTLKEIKEENKKWQIPITKPINFSEKDILIDPYLLGCLIADGSFLHNHVTFYNSEKDILDKVTKNLPKECDLSIISQNRFSPGYRIKKVKRGNEKNIIVKCLTFYRLMNKYSYEKFIPKEYLYNSIEIRQKLLQGLFDCDGYIGGNNNEYSTTSKQLAKDIRFLVESLGGKVNISTRVSKWIYKGEKKEGRDNYRLYIVLPNEVSFFSSKKHKEKFIPKSKYNNAARKIISVKYIGEKEVGCITVDNKSNLYLIQNCIVIHNSVIALDIMSKLKKTTCVIVHKTFLANQWIEYIKEFLLIPENRIGIINGDNIDIENKWIIVCLVQSLLASSTSQPKEFYNQFGMVIFDEVHHFSANTFREVIGKFSCRYRLGISATPNRVDGMEEVFFKHIGRVCFVSEVRQVVPDVYIIKGNILIASERPFMNYLGKVQLWKVEEFLCNSEIRNKKIVENIISAVKAERKVLILSGRRKHLELLKGMLEIELEQKHIHTTIGFYMGGMKEKELKISEKCTVIFGTFSMSSEGLNLPLVDTLILTTPKSNIEQSIGRVLRKVEGKKVPVVIDFADNIGICKNMLKKRKILYRSLKYNIKKECIL
jgi:superfamily II DNA or RNA helicase